MIRLRRTTGFHVRIRERQARRVAPGQNQINIRLRAALRAVGQQLFSITNQPAQPVVVGVVERAWVSELGHARALRRLAGPLEEQTARGQR